MNTRWLPVASLAALAGASPCPARPWIHDQDESKIDDRIERVHQEGRAAAFEHGDSSKRMRIALFEDPLRASSASTSRIESIPAKRIWPSSADSVSPW
jgi:hypothetical protein